MTLTEYNVTDNPSALVIRLANHATSMQTVVTDAIRGTVHGGEKNITIRENNSETFQYDHSEFAGPIRVCFLAYGEPGHTIHNLEVTMQTVRTAVVEDDYKQTVDIGPRERLIVWFNKDSLTAGTEPV